MKYFKLIAVILTLTALVQFLYFGLNDCNHCEFGGMNIKEFFNLYKSQCLNTIEYIDKPQLNFEQINPLPEMEKLPYKNVRNST